MERVIVKFNGGLGNQMFQYAFAKGIETKYGMRAVFDMSFFDKSYSRPFELGIFGIEPEKICKFSDKFKIAFLWKFRKYINSFGGINLICEED